jgi:hypothetical protein
MTASPVVQIQASFCGNQPLLSLLEGNFDLEQVAVSRIEYAVKPTIPLHRFNQNG